MVFHSKEVPNYVRPSAVFLIELCCFLSTWSHLVTLLEGRHLTKTTLPFYLPL